MSTDEPPKSEMPVKQEGDTEDIEEPEGEEPDEPVSESENSHSDGKNDSLENIKQPMSDDDINLEQQPEEENDHPIIIKKKKKPIKKKSGFKMTQFEDIKGSLREYL